MTRVAPVNLPFNVKTLWFDPEDIDVHAGDKVVVRTARGLELGVVESDVFEVDYTEIKKLKSPLRPIERIATEEDERQADEMERLSREAMPIFKRLAREENEDMHPVSVEYMLDGDKAIFYFEAEERIDFRDLVRKLASEFHVRIDMRQIGVRDEARIVGGLAHCGQIVCCKRLGGEFKPVSIRMAKDQDLSLNPQKISGLCGRLMCCLRYENKEYKDFKAKAPKVDARIDTPDGEGRVVEHDVPRDEVAVKVGEDKPVKVPLSAFTLEGDDRKHAKVDPEAWERAVEEAQIAIYGGIDLLQLPTFTGEDKLGSAKAVHHDTSKPKRSRRASDKDSDSAGGDKHRRSRNRSHSSKDGEGEKKRTPRRRSTKIKSGSGEKETTVAPEGTPSEKGASKGSKGKSGSKQKSTSKSRGAGKQKSPKQPAQKSGVRPGHKSSGLAKSEGKPAGGKPAGEKASGEKASSGNRRRRRRRRSSGSGASGAGGGAKGASGATNSKETSS